MIMIHCFMSMLVTNCVEEMYLRKCMQIRVSKITLKANGSDIQILVHA